MFTKKPEAGNPGMDIPPAPPKPPMPQNAGASPRPAAAAPGLRAGEKLAPSVIGPDLTIMGNMISKGEIQIDGVVQGDLHGTHVVVGEKARITGGIVADDVIVRGHVEGSVRGLRVTLQSSSRVEGDIYHQSLAIEQGAYFEGKSRRAEDPMAGVKSPDVKQQATAPAQAPAPAPAAAPIAAAPAAANGAAAKPPHAS